MSKKILILVLFLMSVLTISCSNKDKTGDGGTTQTPEGIAKYAGTWTATFDNGMTTYDIIIGTNGIVIIKDTAGERKAENVQGSGNKYTMNVQHGSTVDPSIVTITFESDNSGTIDDESFGKGTITKNN